MKRGEGKKKKHCQSIVTVTALKPFSSEECKIGFAFFPFIPVIGI